MRFRPPTAEDVEVEMIANVLRLRGPRLSHLEEFLEECVATTWCSGRCPRSTISGQWSANDARSMVNVHLTYSLYKDMSAISKTEGSFSKLPWNCHTISWACLPHRTLQLSKFCLLQYPSRMAAVMLSNGISPLCSFSFGMLSNPLFPLRVNRKTLFIIAVLLLSSSFLVTKTSKHFLTLPHTADLTCEPLTFVFFKEALLLR